MKTQNIREEVTEFFNRNLIGLAYGITLCRKKGNVFTIKKEEHVDWDRYSKSWHRVHGPARAKGWMISLNFDLYRYTKRAEILEADGVPFIAKTKQKTRSVNGEKVKIWNGWTWNRNGNKKTCILAKTKNGTFYHLVDKEGADAEKLAARRALQKEKKQQKTREQNKAFLREAKTFYVTLEDSLKSGNCKTGTLSFKEKYGLSEPARAIDVLEAGKKAGGLVEKQARAAVMQAYRRVQRKRREVAKAMAA